MHCAAAAGQVRRVTSQFYGNRAFYELVFRECVSAQGHFRDIRARITQRCQEHGSELASLLPVNMEWWERLVEEIMNSGPVVALRQRLRAECLQHQEFTYCSVDATVKCCMALVGQATYRTPQALRSDQAIPESEAIYKALVACATLQ